MHIVGIRLKNWMRFKGEFELELGPGCYALIAEHVDDSGMSNGLGKSSLFGAIRWCLEGTKVEGVKTLDSLITRGEDEMAVDLELSDGTFISRAKTRSKSTSLEVHEGNRVSRGDDAQLVIERILGIGNEDRLTTCWSEQRELAVMLDATPSELTKMVEGWMGEDLVKLSEASDRVVELLKDAAEDHSIAVQTHNQLLVLGDASRIASAEVEVNIQRKLFEASTKKYEEYQSGDSSRKERDRVRVLEEEYVTISNNIASAESQIDDEVDALGSSDSQLIANIKELDETSRELSVKVADARRETTRLKVLVTEEFDGVCPVSEGFECPAKSKINARSKENTESYKKALENYKVVNTDLTKIETEKKGLEAEKRQRELVRVARERKLGRIEELKKRLNVVKGEIEAYKERGIVLDGSRWETPIKPPTPDRYALSMAEKNLADSERAREGLQDAFKRVEATAMTLRAHRLAASILGPEGARRRVTEKSVKVIEDEANRVLSEAGVDQQVKASWGRETGSAADQCFECGRAFPASLKIKRCEGCGATRGPKIRHEFTWELSFVSGAGNDLAGLGLRIGGFKWLKNMRGAAWGVAVLDEATGQMDASRKKAVSASIRRMMVGIFEQTYISSHDSTLLESCDHKILIKGYGPAKTGYSTIEVLQ